MAAACLSTEQILLLMQQEPEIYKAELLFYFCISEDKHTSRELAGINLGVHSSGRIVPGIGVLECIQSEMRIINKYE